MTIERASDNPFPSILIVEGTEPAAPAAGQQRLYIDSTTHLLKLTNSSGTDTTVGAGGSAPTTIRGRVAGSGTITSGTGFTITRNSAGDYTINYTSSFTNPPVILLSSAYTDMSAYTVTPMMVAGDTDTTSATRIIIRDLASLTKSDRPWMFIAMEP